MAERFSAADFQIEAGVSRETLERLEAYVALLTKWQKAVNLVGQRSLSDVWHRHIFDSAQLLALAAPDARTWIDVGSGAGLPGLVLAILGAGQVVLIEKDERKCAFLREAVRVTGATAEVVESRVESLGRIGRSDSPLRVPDVITARAVAPLDKLLELVQPLCDKETDCLFLKGQHVAHELTVIAKYTDIYVDELPSRTASDATILRIRGLGHDASK